jgi:ComF family protein
VNLIYSYLEDFLSLFFPELCCACGTNLYKNENVICTSCIYQLPYTNFHLDKDNRVAKQFYGRVPFISATSFLYFTKGSKVRNLIHQLKYNNKPEVGIKIGEMFGMKLKEVEEYNNIDLIIPVPLHAKRLKKRGYNQSEYFAIGLSNKLQVPYNTTILIRTTATETQTHKSRFARFENMKEVFKVTDQRSIAGKHILLVDDVLTTGATIEACVLELLKADNAKISIATIAFAD